MALVRGRHFIKEWRKHRGLSLRKLSDRLEVDPAGESIASHARLQRVEKGEVGYDEELLHALAHALNTTIFDLLEVNPLKQGEVVDLMRRLTPDQKIEAQKYIEFLLSKSA